MKAKLEPIKATCKDCGAEFIIEPAEQRYFKSIGYELPKRCKSCLNKRAVTRKKEKQQQIEVAKAKEAEERQKQREEDEKTLQKLLKESIYNQGAFPNIDKDTLVIIGNGFDLAHNIPSSYYCFRDKTHGSVKDALELFIDVDDVWGDFENNLAYLDREKVLLSMWLEKDINGVLEEEDDDFSAADFYMSIDSGGWAIDTIVNELPIAFRRWINSLVVDGREPIYNLFKEAHYLSFNYTETLETVYGINKNNINYIHGDRRNKKHPLVLGHGNDGNTVFDQWWEKNKNRKDLQPYLYNKKGKRIRNDNPVYLAYFLEDEIKGNWHNQTNYDYIECCARKIEEYYDDSAKKINEVIKANENYFKSLSDIKRIVTIGHSLSKVDIPYFKQIYENVNNDTEWYIGFHSLKDYKRIEEFINELNLNNKKVYIFRI